MMERYLNKQALFPALIKEPIPKDLGLTVLIPAHNEPDILNTIKSIEACSKPSFPFEVIILFNDKTSSTEAIKQQNQNSHQQVIDWCKKENLPHYHSLYLDNLPQKHAGAGLARKIAMDEAIRRFAAIKNPNGILVSLDADCTVSSNYLTSIAKAYQNPKKTNCTVHNFEHPLQQNTKAISSYELHLRYYRLALNYTGFPYAFHTIGSCFSVQAETYCKQGGMNKKQAGEDFYFLNKIFPLGKTTILNNLCVFPSARLSDRVPFGTGPTLKKITEEKHYKSYSPEAFKDLGTFFKLCTSLFGADNKSISDNHKELPQSMQTYLSHDTFLSAIQELNSNSANPLSFRKRFFNWFNGFQVVKFLNFSHANFYHKEDITRCVSDFSALHKECPEQNSKELNILLTAYRELDRKITPLPLQ